jgi:hypothetical protein
MHGEGVQGPGSPCPGARCPTPLGILPMTASRPAAEGPIRCPTPPDSLLPASTGLQAAWPLC